MQEQIKITNKVISIEKIKEIAIYLQGLCQKYTKLIEEDKEKNEKLDYADKQPLYDGNTPHIEYTIELLDGKRMTERDYKWFVNMLKETKNIKCISYKLNIYFTSGTYLTENCVSKSLYTNLDFYDNRVDIFIDGKELKDEVQQVYSDLRTILDSCATRYDKTIKRRFSRMQCFYFCVGLVFAYISLFLLLSNITSLPPILTRFLENDYIILVLHLGISIFTGNIFGGLYMKKLYENILPERRYSHYSDSAKKSIYVDDINEYTEKNEVQIGKFYNSIERRNKIESIFKISKLIFLIQLCIYALFIVKNLL